MKIRSAQGKNNTHFSFRYELISYTFDILHKISKNANKFQTFSFTNLVEAKRTNCCLLLTNSVVSNLQDHWVHDHWGDRTLVLFSFPISWELFLFPWVNDAVGRLGFWLAHVDELAKRGTVLVIGINAERLGIDFVIESNGKISQRLFLFGVVDSSQARLDDGMIDGTVAVESSKRAIYQRRMLRDRRVIGTKWHINSAIHWRRHMKNNVRCTALHRATLTIILPVFDWLIVQWAASHVDITLRTWIVQVEAKGETMFSIRRNYFLPTRRRQIRCWRKCCIAGQVDPNTWWEKLWRWVWCIWRIRHGFSGL